MYLPRMGIRFRVMRGFVLTVLFGWELLKAVAVVICVLALLLALALVMG